MKIKGTAMLSKMLAEGRKGSQQQAASKIGISRTSLAMMEVDPDAVARASWGTVVKALRQAGYVLEISPAPTLKLAPSRDRIEEQEPA